MIERGIALHLFSDVDGGGNWNASLTPGACSTYPLDLASKPPPKKINFLSFFLKITSPLNKNNQISSPN